MKTIGLIGGITWLSSMDYYRLANQKINATIGGVSSAQIIVYSVNFAEVKALTLADDWHGLAKIMSNAAQKLALAGADCILIGANTMHNIADQVAASINVPLIHIVETTAAQIVTQKINKVALLGTKYTMQLPFYKDKLATYGIDTIIPDETDIEFVNDCIYNEMSKGIFLPERKAAFIVLINKLIEQGAQGIILGCTEIPILIQQADCAVPVFDTTDIHMQAAVDFVLE
jgi:aspartate racemase